MIGQTNASLRIWSHKAYLASHGLSSHILIQMALSGMYAGFWSTSRSKFVFIQAVNLIHELQPRPLMQEEPLLSSPTDFLLGQARSARQSILTALP